MKTAIIGAIIALTITTGAVVTLSGGQPGWSQPSVDRGLPEYRASQTVSGRIRADGPTTSITLLGAWMDQFKTYQSGVQLEERGQGSARAAARLAAGEIDVALMSRPMTPDEAGAFQRRRGGAPAQLIVAYEPVALFVHKGNQVPGLTMDQLRHIFTGQARRWSDVGASGPLGSQAIRAFGMSPESGPNELMQRVALGGAAFAPGVQEKRSSGVVSAVGVFENAIGYGPASLDTSRVRAVPIGARAGAFVPATPGDVASERYPLAGELHLYLSTPRGQSPPPAVAELLRFILSRQGQEIAASKGAAPLSAAKARAELARAGL